MPGQKQQRGITAKASHRSAAAQAPRIKSLPQKRGSASTPNKKPPTEARQRKLPDIKKHQPPADSTN